MNDCQECTSNSQRIETASRVRPRLRAATPPCSCTPGNRSTLTTGKRRTSEGRAVRWSRAEGRRKAARVARRVEQAAAAQPSARRAAQRLATPPRSSVVTHGDARRTKRLPQIETSDVCNRQQPHVTRSSRVVHRKSSVAQLEKTGKTRRDPHQSGSLTEVRSHREQRTLLQHVCTRGAH